MCIRDSAIFKQNKGWEILQTWMKAGLLWKYGIIRWDFVEDFQYKIEEYDGIDQAKLDELLSNENVALVGDLEFENKLGEVADPLAGDARSAEVVYVNVRIRRKVDKSRVKLENIPHENPNTPNTPLFGERLLLEDLRSLLAYSQTLDLQLALHSHLIVAHLV